MVTIIIIYISSNLKEEDIMSAVHAMYFLIVSVSNLIVLIRKLFIFIYFISLNYVLLNINY